MVEHYRVDRFLGSGAMGEVYLARDTRLGRRVALKLVRPDALGDAEAVRRFLFEAQVTARFNHPHIVTIYGVGEHQGRPYVALEYLEGQSLRERLQTQPLGLNEAALIGAAIAEALGEAHASQVLHRDLKPENVMVPRDGRLRVVDFGLAKAILASTLAPEEDAPPAPADAVTATLEPPHELAQRLFASAAGALRGTPLYMAPEQWQCLPVGPAADVWALGLILYEMVAGRHPYQGMPVFALCAQICSQAPVPWFDGGLAVPPALDAMMRRCLAKSPGDRPSARSVAETLRATVPTGAAAPSTRVEASEPPAVGALPAPASRLPSSAGDTAGGTARSARALSAPRAPASRRRWLGALGLGVVLLGGLGAIWLATRPPKLSAASAPPAAAPSATAVTALPRPATTNAQALAAHDEGMQAIRDANFDVALRAFQRAVRADPGFAAGWMRVAMVGYGILPLSEIREAFQKAMEHRSSLSERDKVFLDSFDPFISREPADLAEAERRSALAVERWPLDGELVEALAYVQLKRGRFAPMLETTDRAIAIDPDFADPWSLKGVALAQLGRFPEAVAALEQCADRFPAATDCLKVEADILEQQGSCAQMEAVARRWLAKQPASGGALGALAAALVATGKRRETVVAALEQKWARIEEPRRATVEVGDRLPLDVLAGDFSLAEHDAHELERAVAADSNEASHLAPGKYLVELAFETGRAGEAGRFAADFLLRREAWIADAGSDVALDPTPLMLRAQVRAELLSPGELALKRGLLVDKWRTVLPSSLRGSLWIAAYASIAETPEQAHEALAALPEYAPLPPFVPFMLADAELGRVYALAGEVERATAVLRRATTSCRAYKEPFAHTRAHYELGVALEAAGDHAGACRALSVVLERWGHARPRSVTADKARDRMRALSCEAPR
jgi:eukaryotic-like serine/threonine-protein kinase